MDLDWTPSPVLHFDFNTEDFTREDGLEELLNALLSSYEKIYGSDPAFRTISQRFQYVIKAAYEKTGRQVVILIDEYDKPLLAIEHNKQLLEKNQALLKGFFGNLKSMDRYIRFAFVTGVARFRKVSIFSDLNNLDDISIEDDFANICGWTEKELLETYQPGIKELAKKRKEDFGKTVDTLRNYYNGYLFAIEGERLYNPDRGSFPPDLNGQMCEEHELLEVGLNDRNPVPFSTKSAPSRND